MLQHLIKNLNYKCTAKKKKSRLNIKMVLEAKICNYRTQNANINKLFLFLYKPQQGGMFSEKKRSRKPNHRVSTILLPSSGRKIR